MSIRWRLVWIVGLVAACVFLLVPRDVERRVYDPSSGQMVETTVRTVPIALGLDLRGGIHLALEVDESMGRVADCEDAIRRSERVVRSRLDEFGTADRTVQVVGGCRLIVELPGIQDPERARSIVQRSAFLEFRLTDSRGAFQAALPALDQATLRSSGEALSTLLVPGQIAGEFLVAEERVAAVDSLLAAPEVQRRIPRGIELRWGTRSMSSDWRGHRVIYALQDRAIVTGEALRGATAGTDPQTGIREVQFQLSRTGGQRFGDATARNIGNHLAIVLDGRVEGRPPSIQSRITTSGRIELPGRTLQEANDLALVLRAGALPVPLEVVEQGTVGPSLGEDSIRTGVQASVLAVALVLLVMAGYYRFAGLLAVAGLVLYVLFTLGGLAAVGAALTLPGLAGFALSIGMALDANVLIFERIREELATGTPVRVAVDAGFRNAMSAIVDSNVTTALTALILYVVGTGPVQGFAVTLLIGLVASMVTAVFVTRTFFLIWLRRRGRMAPVNGLSNRPLRPAAYDFLRWSRWALRTSVVLILPALLLLGVYGATYGIEFTGGTLTRIRTAEPVAASTLRSVLEAGELGAAEVQSFGSDREYLIRARVAEGGAGGVPASAAADAVRQALDAGLSPGAYEVLRAESVTPRLGDELQQKALIAVLCSFGTTLVYLSARFEWRFALAAVLATAHDILATVAFIRYLDLEVSLVVVAAVLTVLGYSLNDTIVIFDRVRENLAGRSAGDLRAVLNRSIAETLPRTLLTGGTTLASALVLAFLAGEVIRPFGLVMAFGVAVGTFSSILIAAPALLWIEGRRGAVRAESRSRPA